MIATDLVKSLGVRSLLDELRCPYCGGRLEPDPAFSEPAEDLRYGILKCHCGESPIVDGIVWISRRREGIVPQDDPALDRVLHRLRQGEHSAALQEALLGSSRHWMRKAATICQRLGKTPPQSLLDASCRNLKRSLIDQQDLTFAQAADMLRNKPYADYLYHRFANPSILAAIPVILLLSQIADDRPPRILDLCGGAGHASFLIHHFFPNANLILCDADFANLYLARRFLAPRAVCICADGEARLPLLDRSLDAIFCLDAFHYIREKVGLVHEMRRCVRPGGLWLLPHLHNALAYNPTPGYPLEPRAYERLFDFLDCRIFSEASLLGQFSTRRGIDLTDIPRSTALDQANALTLIGGDESTWREHDFSRLYTAHLDRFDITPTCRAPDGSLRAPEWPTEQLARECNGIEAYLDVAVAAHRDALARFRRGTHTPADREAIDTLINNFILLPLPDRYG